MTHTSASQNRLAVAKEGNDRTGIYWLSITRKATS